MLSLIVPTFSFVFSFYSVPSMVENEKPMKFLGYEAQICFKISEYNKMGFSDSVCDSSYTNLPRKNHDLLPPTDWSFKDYTSLTCLFCFSIFILILVSLMIVMGLLFWW